MSKKKSTVELPKPHPTRTKSRPLEFLKHTQQLVDLYPKTTTSKITGNPIYSEKRRRKLVRSINSNMIEAAKDIFGEDNITIGKR